MSLVETITETTVKAKSEQKPAVVYRVDVLPLSLEFAEQIHVPQLGTVYAYPVYWFQTEATSEKQIEQLAQSVLVDPIVQRFVISSDKQKLSAFLALTESQSVQWVLEKQFLPGVTDNLAKTVESSIQLLFSDQELSSIKVASGQVYWIPETALSQAQIAEVAEYQLYNPLIQKLNVFSPQQALAATERYAFPVVESTSSKTVQVIPLNISDEALTKLSQNRNLALTLDEMKVIQQYYQRADVQQFRQEKGLALWPTDVELEIFAQTWSEHCKHKIFAAKIEYVDATCPEWPETYIIDGLFKTYIAGSTQKLMAQRPDLLSVFKDNAGVLQWNDDWGICFKVETHNSPSALEPYGGALTGIVGVNRDILGTGLGAKPLFNTDVFCFAHPDEIHASRPTMIPAESILIGVRKGVEDGGNKSGIPTVNGSLFFDSRYRAKPLVFCGTGGLLPLKVGEKVGYQKYTEPGDTIVMAGGRVGKDGIHGATFSSEALHQNSPVSAVQIGDPLTQKRMTDFLLEAQTQGLITGITDNGAGGLSSSVGEMAEITNGATLYLDQVPLKYPGLEPYEVMISESQERMTISTQNYDALKQLADRYDVEISNIGAFHTDGTLTVYAQGEVVACLDLNFLHHGLPQMQLKAVWAPPQRVIPIRAEAPQRDIESIFLRLLKNPNICSREALIRQYDHEVQGRSVIKPLMGPLQTAPCDAAVIQPILGQPAGLVVSNGLCPQYSDWDAYHMAACAVDEAVRNAVAVGADPKTIALLDNFCWPDPLPSARNTEAEHKLAQLVRANLALYDIALAYGTPLISGKDSMKNDFDDGEFRLSIPPTLLISAIGKIPDFEKAVTMEFKSPGDQIFLLGKTNVHMGGTQYYNVMGWFGSYSPRVNTILARQLYPKLFHCIQQGWIRSCHDLSEGGLGVALAESAFGGRYGIEVSLQEVIHDSPELRWDEALFSESPSRFVISVATEYVDAVKAVFEQLPLLHLGQVTEKPTYCLGLDEKSLLEKDYLIQLSTESLRESWRRAPAACYASGMAP